METDERNAKKKPRSILTHGNPNYVPGRRYINFLSDTWGQAFLRRQYQAGNPNVVVLGSESPPAGTAEDKAVREANERGLFKRMDEERDQVVVRMIRSRQAGAPDGITVVDLPAGKKVKVRRVLAEALIAGGDAELVDKEDRDGKNNND